MEVWAKIRPSRAVAIHILLPLTDINKYTQTCIYKQGILHTDLLHKQWGKKVFS